jgi:hypothetical protein
MKRLENFSKNIETTKNEYMELIAIKNNQRFKKII